mgnify:CR=1 FL=1
MKGTFEEYLRKTNLSENTIESYLWTVDFYHSHYDSVSKENLLAYKGYLMEFFKPKTVNLRIQAMNKYLDYLGKEKLRLKAVKVQQKNFLENVISNADYNFLKKQLKKDGNMEWYFVVWYLAATGARVSELIQIKIEHVELGYFDLYSKGGKLRRLYIPKKLRNETMEWLKEEKRTFGYLFLNRFGERITTRGISQQLKNYADKYGLDKRWFILIHSVTVMPRISSKSTMTLHCLPTLWDTKASKQHEFTCAVPPANNRSLSIKS